MPACVIFMVPRSLSWDCIVRWYRSLSDVDRLVIPGSFSSDVWCCKWSIDFWNAGFNFFTGYFPKSSKQIQNSQMILISDYLIFVNILFSDQIIWSRVNSASSDNLLCYYNPYFFLHKYRLIMKRAYILFIYFNSSERDDVLYCFCLYYCWQDFTPHI